MAQVVASELVVKVGIDAREASDGLKKLSDTLRSMSTMQVVSTEQTQSLNNLTTSARSSAGAFDDLAKRAAQVRIDKLTDDIVNQTGKLALLRERLKEVSDAKGADDRATRGLALQVQALESRINSSVQSLNIQKEKFAQMQTPIEQAKTALQKFGDEANKVATNLPNKFSKLEEVVVGGLRKIGESIVSGILPAFGRMVNIGAEFEQTMGVLAYASGASAAEFEAMKQKAQDLGADLTLPAVSANDAAIAMLELSKAGLQTSDVLAASKGVMQLAAAGQMDVADAANVTAAALNTFKLEGSQATNVANMLAAASNATMANVSDLAYGIQNAGFAFQATGQSVDDLIIAVAGLTQNGLTGSDAATALKNAFLQLAAPTSDSMRTMMQLGINVRDASGNMLPFRDLIIELKRGLSDLSPAQRDMALKTMVQSDGMKALIPWLEMGAEGYDDLSEKTHNATAAQDMAAARMQGLKGAWEGLGSQLETLMNNAIQPLLPLMTSMVQGVANFAGTLATHAEPAVQRFVQGLTNFKNAVDLAFGWLAEHGKAILVDIGMVLGGLITTFIAFNAQAAITAVVSASAGVSMGGLAFGLGAVAVNAAAALAPFALMAASLWLVVEAGNKVNELLGDVSQKSLEFLSTKEWWQEAEQAERAFIETGALATETTKQKYDALHAEREAMYVLTQQYALGQVSEENYLAQGQQLRDSIKEKTTSLEQEIAAVEKSTEAWTKSAQQANVNQREMDAYAKTIPDVTQAVYEAGGAFANMASMNEEAQKGLKSVVETMQNDMGSMLSGTLTFYNSTQTAQETHNAKIKTLTEELANATTEKQRQAIQDKITAEQTGFRDQQRDAATAYAEQQGALRAHLGAMILEWLGYQATVNPNIRAHYDELVSMTESRYGVVADTQIKMTDDVLNVMQDYANGVITSQAEANAILDETEDAYNRQAIAAQKLREKYVTEIQTKWESGAYGSDPEQAFLNYQRDLGNVEKRVQTTLALEAAQAQAEAAQTKEKMDRIPNNMQSKIFLDANSVDLGAGKATTAIRNVPSEKYIAFKDNTIEAGNNAKGYATTVQTTVPKTVTTTANFNQGTAVADARTVGTNMGAGLAEGITGQTGTVMARMRMIVQAAVAAAQAAGKIASPSGETRDKIGAPMTEGVAVGMMTRMGMVLDVFKKVVAGGVNAGVVEAADGMSKINSAISGGLDAMQKMRTTTPPTIGQIQAFAENLHLIVTEFAARFADSKKLFTKTSAEQFDTLSKFVDVIGKSVEALGKLSTFIAPSRETLLSFSMTLRDVMADFWHRQQEISYTADDSVTLFSETAHVVVSVIGDGVEALNALNQFRAPPREALFGFSMAVRDAVADFWHRSREISYALDQSTLDFATTADKVLETIGKGVESLTKLGSFTAPSRESLLNFSLALRDVVADFWHRSQEVEYALNDSTTRFADIASKSVETIGKGVEGFAKLADFAPVSRESISLFSLALRDTVAEFAQRTAELDPALFEVTSAFAETAGNVVDVIGKGVEGFVALQTFGGVPHTALEAFARDLETTIRIMSDMASRFDIDGVEVAAQFAESVGKILDPISTGVDAFTSLREYEGVASAQMQMIFHDMQQATALMVAISQNADKDGVEAAAKFSESVGKVFDALSSGVDALSSLREYESVPQERMSAFANDMMTAFTMIDGLANTALGIQGRGDVWQKALESFANSIRAGIDAIASLDGANVNISATVSASAGTGGEGEGGGDQPDGSHALGLYRVPFDGYLARLHEGERVLTASEAAQYNRQLSVTNTTYEGATSGNTINFNAPLIETATIASNGMELDDMVEYLADALTRKLR